MTHNNPKLYFTLGPPRSGKSTYCTNFSDHNHNVVIVCADSIRKSLGHEYHESSEPIVQGIKYTMIRALLDRGHDVIVDGTHSTEHNIREIFKIQKEAIPIWIPNYKLYYHAQRGSNHDADNYFDYVQLCKRRGRETKGEYIIPVIERIIGNLRHLAYHNNENLDLLRDYI